MDDSSLNVNVEQLRRVDLVTATGRIDSSTAPEFDQALKTIMDGNRYNIVLDMSGVNYVSSAGLRAIVSAMRDCRRNRGDVRLAAPSERVNEVLKLAGLDSLFESFDDTTSAVGSF